MPKTKTFLTPVEYAVLGLLRHRPAHGYELQRQLSGRHGLGLVCPVEPAMVYAILKSLSGLELIDGEWDNRSYPPKAIYSVTENGDSEFQRWLMRPVGRMREVRLDLMVKLYFLMLEEPSVERTETRNLIEGQIDFCENYAAELQHEIEAVDEGSFDALALGSKLSAARLTRVWLTDCLESLTGSRGSQP
jgi:DNA-binding PadR family transcriptional regulator